MVKIRLTRVGRKKRPHYRIVATDKYTRRDGEYIDYLGWYDPLQKEPEKKIKLNMEKYQSWVKKGAQPSITIVGLIKHAKLLK